jgi:hypothetical protein
MSIHIQLDRRHAHYTNLDYLSGKVILTLIRDEAISAINVKLECESRTRLAAIRPDGRQQTELEVHKVGGSYHCYWSRARLSSDSCCIKSPRPFQHKTCSTVRFGVAVIHLPQDNMSTLFNSRYSYPRDPGSTTPDIYDRYPSKMPASPSTPSSQV